MFKQIEFCDICNIQKDDLPHYSGREWLRWAKYSICPSCSIRSFHEIVSDLLHLRDSRIKKIEEIAATRPLTFAEEVEAITNDII